MIRINVWFKIKAFILAIVAIITCFVLNSAMALPAEDVRVELSSIEAQRGDKITLSLNISYPVSPGCAAFNLDINYDPLVLENPSGAAVQNIITAGKQVIFKKVSEGVFRIVVFGFTQDIIQEGEALKISFDVKQGAALGESLLQLKNVSMSSPLGTRLLVALTDGVLTVIAAANNPPVLVPIANVIANEGDTIIINPVAVDADGDKLTYSVNGLPEGAAYILDPDTGKLVWASGYNEAGMYTLTFTVDDGKD